MLQLLRPGHPKGKTALFPRRDNMNIKFIPPVIILAGAVAFMVWFFASGAAMPGG
jgi:hypothetical protein